MLTKMLATYLAASLIPLAVAVAVPQQTYDFVSILVSQAESKDHRHGLNHLDCYRWRYSRCGIRYTSQPEA